MGKPILIAVGILATGLALLGAILPGLPTTPFLIVALWAFARSSERMARGLERIPLFRSALAEARRFEQRGAVRLRIKLTAMTFAWGSVAITGVGVATLSSPVFIVVLCAAAAATLFMIWIPTDRGPGEL